MVAKVRQLLIILCRAVLVEGTPWTTFVLLTIVAMLREETCRLRVGSSFIRLICRGVRRRRVIGEAWGPALDFLQKPRS